MMDASSFLTWSFAALAILVAAVFPISVTWARLRLGAPRPAALRAGIVAAAALATWMTITGVAAAAGYLDFGRLPPPMGIIVVAALIGAVTLSASPIGRDLAAGLPLAFLVGVQNFRLPLELIMHRAATEGVMPVQMSYSGLNFDILTGVGAILVAGLLWRGRASLRVVRAWNWMGLVLLINITVISILSTPTPLRVFDAEPANVWITHAPFVWLPAVMVTGALFGHLVVFRRLRLERTAAVAASAMAGPAAVPPHGGTAPPASSRSRDS